MEYKARYITPDIKLSCYEDKFFKSDISFEHHMLIWFISGETKIVQADAVYRFRAGDIFLIPRNQLATIINYPLDGLPHKTVVMHLTTERLKAFYSGLKVSPQAAGPGTVRSFHRHPLLESCLTSLIPYFDLKDPFPEEIAAIKITEAINILRLIDQDVDSVLAVFEEPGKIDLADFMEKNFMFNMPIGKFGYLTGRSLTTFKRDFKKVYHTSPQKWLMQKRLERAHYLLSQGDKRPSDIYFEAGFENLSHFSHAFRKHFGYTATDLFARKPHRL